MIIFLSSCGTTNNDSDNDRNNAIKLSGSFTAGQHITFVESLMNIFTKKVYALKKREDTKALICLVANQAMLERHVKEVPEVAYDIMDLATKPTTIVFDEPIGIASNLVAEDNTLAIRVASDKFCQYLINKFRKPIVSTSANISGNPTPKQFKDIEEEILKGVDYVVNLPEENINPSPSSIIKLSNDGQVKVIRE